MRNLIKIMLNRENVILHKSGTLLTGKLWKQYIMQSLDPIYIISSFVWVPNSNLIKGIFILEKISQRLIFFLSGSAYILDLF